MPEETTTTTPAEDADLYTDVHVLEVQPTRHYVTEGSVTFMARDRGVIMGRIRFTLGECAPGLLPRRGDVVKVRGKGYMGRILRLL